MLCKYNNKVRETPKFLVNHIKFLVFNKRSNIKSLAFNIKFLVFRGCFSRIMRAREDRHNRRCLDRNKAFKPFLSRRKRLLDEQQ